MFNLVKYRYVFLIISLLVIIPGTISLALFHLKVGIDFAGGSNVELRPQKALTATEIKNLVAPLKLQDLQVVLGDNTNLGAKKTVWIRLNTLIDKGVQDSITNTLKQKYADSTITVSFVNLTPAGSKPYTLATVVGFKNDPKVSDIQEALNKLPNTSDPTKGASTSAPTSTTTPTATGTATATPQAAGTPAANGTPVVAPSGDNPANIPVSVQDVQQGSTTQIVTLLTRTSFKTEDFPRLQAEVLNAKGPYMYLSTSAEVGASVASETTQNAVLAVLAASACILLYIWFSFRKIPKAWRYGACAIIAMLHDVLVVLGIFSILGVLFNMQVDALFITALLTVVGFSVHDTIVVFDRIRENLHRRTTESFEQVVNASLVQTMARSLNTSLTVLFTLLALTLFTGIGTSIHTFTLTLLIGIFSGTYSSIFNASMLLVIWEHGELGLGRFNRGQDRDRSRRAERRETPELVRSR